MYIEKTEIVQDPEFHPIPGVQVTIRKRDDTLADIFDRADPGTAIALPNPVTTDQFGAFTLFASPDSYIAEYWYAGHKIREDIFTVGDIPTTAQITTAVAAAAGSAADALADAIQTAADRVQTGLDRATATTKAAIATAAAATPALKVQTNPATPTTPPSGVSSGDQYWAVNSGSTAIVLYLNTSGTGAPVSPTVSIMLAGPTSSAIDVIQAALGPTDIFDKTAIIDEAIMPNGSAPGAPGSTAGWFVTPLIPVKSGGQIVFNTITGQAGFAAQFYAADQTTRIASPNTSVAAGTPITVPDGASWMRTNVNKSNGTAAAMMAAWGATLPATYRPFGIPEKGDILSSVRTAVLPYYSDRTLNLVLPGNVVQGYYITAGATTETANTDWCIAVVPVTPGGTVTLSYKTYQGFYWVDAFGTKAGAAALGSPVNVSPAGGYQLAVPATAVELHYSLEKTNLPNLQILEGAVTLPTTTLAPTAPVTPAKLADRLPWYGMKWGCQGTSIEANLAWLAVVGKSHGVASVSNYALGGSDSRHNLFKGGTSTAAPALQSSDIAALDMIYLSQFTNDLNNSIPMGSVSDRPGNFTGSISGTVLTVSAFGSGTPLAVGQTIWCPAIAWMTTIASLGTGTGGTGTYNLKVGDGTGTYTQTQTVSSQAMKNVPTTTWGLTRNFVEVVTAWQPKIRIVLETPIQRFETSLTNYTNMKAMRDAVIDMACVFSCSVNDLFRDSGANEYTYTAGAASGYTLDGVHPTDPVGYTALKIQPTIGFFHRVRPRTTPQMAAA